MKIIVLGGAGDMGGCAVEDLAADPEVTRVTIADRNVPGAEALRDKLRDAPAEVVVAPVDASDHAGLVAAVRGHDAVASALGPFFRFEAPLLRAAIDAGVPYASICDDWSACEAVIRDLHGAAEAAGVPCITGIGASPGLTNLMAMHLASGFDRVTRVDVNCYQPWTAGGGEAVVRHLLFIVTGEIAAFQGGKALRERACTRKARVEMPHYGWRTLWNLGHPEPSTLHKHLPGVETVNFFMGLGAGMGLLAALGRSGIFANPRAADFAIRLINPQPPGPDKAPGASALRVDVWGEAAGVAGHRMACGLGAMREGTGLPLAAGARFLARRDLRVGGGGVFPPEACLPLAPFMEVMAEKGIVGYTDLALQTPLAAD